MVVFVFGDIGYLHHLGACLHVTNNSLTAIDLSNQTNSLYLIILVIGLVLLAYGVWWFGKKFTE